MINKTPQWAAVLFGGLLLWAAAQAALALDDPALPPGADFQEGLQESSVQHREKRSVIRWLGKGLSKYSLVNRWKSEGYLFIQGRFFSPHARTRLWGDKLCCIDSRMTSRVAVHIANNGKHYWDNIDKRYVHVIPGDGGVVMSNPSKDSGPPGTLHTLVTWQEASGKIKSGRYER